MKMDKLVINLKRILELRNIPYKQFLVDICREILANEPTKSENTCYEMAEKEKANFSNMLKGARPLSKAFYIPIEKVLGISLASICDGTFEKGLFINKGLRYTASLDDYQKYCELFEEKSNDHEVIREVWQNYDEYDNNLLTYILQYQSLEGLKALHDKKGAKVDYCNTHLNILNGFKDEVSDILSLICSKDSDEVFNQYFDIYQTFIENSFVKDWLGLLSDEKNMDQILKAEKIFSSILNDRKVKVSELNPRRGINDEKEVMIANPYIYYLLNFALKHCDTYLEQAKQMIRHGISYNKKLNKFLENNTDYSYCRIEDNGTIYNGVLLYGNIITYKLETQTNFDHEIEMLLDDLNKTINEIKFYDNPKTGGLSLKGVRIVHGNLLKAHSDNEVEYEFLQKVEKYDLPFIPKLISVNDKFDTFTYFKGNSLSYDYTDSCSLEIIKQVIEAIKKKDEVSKEILGNNKVYVHGDLSPRNMIFDKNEFVGFIDWDTAHIGDESEDLIYSIWQLLNIGSLTRNNNLLYDRFKQAISFYKPSKELKHNFADKMILVMNNAIKGTSNDNPNYQRIYEWVGWSKIWVELFRDKIKQDIG